MNLRKFPVTAPDGTEYRVTVEEREGSCGWYAFVKLYVKRKRFGFRRVYRDWSESGDGVYARANPNYIALVERAINFHQGLITRELTESERRANAVEAFTHWNGRVDV